MFEWTVLGDEAVPPHRQAWHVDALSEPDAYRAVPKIVAGIGAINARMAPMIPVFNAVAQDPAGAIYRQSEELRRADMAQLAEALARKTALRKGVTRRRAADLLFVLTGPALYRDFVIEVGWTPRTGRAGWSARSSGTCSRTGDRPASPGERRLPVHLDPVPVRVPALERDIRPFLVALHDGNAVRIHPGQQRPHLIRRRNPEPGVQERRGRLDVLGRVQREVDPSACGWSPSILVLPVPWPGRSRSGRSSSWLGTVPDRQPEVAEVHDGSLAGPQA